MSAINVVVQRDAVHVITDGVSYDADGVVQAIAQKCFAAPTANTVVASIGAGLASMIFAVEIGMRFRSFDDVVLYVEKEMPVIYNRHLNTFSQAPQSDCEVYFVGWSESRRRGEAYTMKVCEPEAADHWRAQAKGTGYTGEPFKLQPFHGIVANPPPSAEEFVRAGLTFDCPAGEVHEHVTPLDLLHLLEIQRRRKVPMRPGLEPHHWVGGLALLTTVNGDGVAQRVLHRWPEDMIGAVISPSPITDWKRWRAALVDAERSRHVTSHGMSRLQREMAEKKLRKAARRSEH